MTIPPDETKAEPIFKKKRDIFRFSGNKEIAINFDHVSCMSLDDVRITFQFGCNATYIDLEGKEAAKVAFEKLLRMWYYEMIKE